MIGKIPCKRARMIIADESLVTKTWCFIPTRTLQVLLCRHEVILAGMTFEIFVFRQDLMMIEGKSHSRLHTPASVDRDTRQDLSILPFYPSASHKAARSLPYGKYRTVVSRDQQDTKIERHTQHGHTTPRHSKQATWKQIIVIAFWLCVRNATTDIFLLYTVTILDYSNSTCSHCKRALVASCSSVQKRSPWQQNPQHIITT